MDTKEIPVFRLYHTSFGYRLEYNYKQRYKEFNVIRDRIYVLLRRLHKIHPVVDFRVLDEDHSDYVYKYNEYLDNVVKKQVKNR